MITARWPEPSTLICPGTEQSIHCNRSPTRYNSDPRMKIMLPSLKCKLQRNSFKNAHLVEATHTDDTKKTRTFRKSLGRRDAWAIFVGCRDNFSVKSKSIRLPTTSDRVAAYFVPFGNLCITWPFLFFTSAEERWRDAESDSKDLEMKVPRVKFRSSVATYPNYWFRLCTVD